MYLSYPKMKSDGEQEREREERKKIIERKSVWRKISAPLFLSPGCFGRGKKQQQQDLVKIVRP